MNDLRSQNRTLTPVPELGPKTGEIVTNPGARRSRTRANPLFESSRSVEEPKADRNGVTAGRPSVERPSTEAPGQPEAQGEIATADARAETLSFPVSRDLRSMPVSATRRSAATPDEAERADEDDEAVSADATASTDNAFSAEQRASGEQPASTAENLEGAASTGDERSEVSRDRNGRAKAPASRPNRRREVADGSAPEDDKFPWHYQFDDDEPEELLAKSPLLSRAFRSSVG